MDNTRFEELKHTLTHGGIPDLSKETFTPDQVMELKPILEERAAKSLELLKDIEGKWGENEFKLSAPVSDEVKEAKE